MQLVDPTYRVEELIQIAQNARPGSGRTRGGHFRRRLPVEARIRPTLATVDFGRLHAPAASAAEAAWQAQVPFQSTAGRSDFDVFAVWSFQNLGFGNAAIQKERRSERDDAFARRGFVLNQIGREVADAFAQSEARRRRFEFSRGRLKTAAAGAREEIDRTRGGEAFPLESINSVNLLVEARDEFIAALVGYDLAQFQLFVAIGQTPSVALPDPQKAGADQRDAAPALGQ